MARIPELLASKRTLSFEFFPPKTPAANMTLGRTVAAIESLHQPRVNKNQDNKNKNSPLLRPPEPQLETK